MNHRDEHSRPDARPKSFHTERAAEAIAHAAAAFIREEAGTNSLITVTRAQTLSKGDRVVVFVSVLPEEQVRNALAFLDRKRSDFSAYLKAHARLGPLPRIDFMPDNGESELFAALESERLSDEAKS